MGAANLKQRHRSIWLSLNRFCKRLSKERRSALLTPMTCLAFLEAALEVEQNLSPKECYLDNEETIMTTPSSWTHSLSSPGDPFWPVLMRVTQIGRVPVSPTQMMPDVLNSCSQLGHAAVMVLHGDRGKHQLYVGARRILEQPAGSTDDYLDLQAHAFRGRFPGLQFSEPSRLNNPNNTQLCQLNRLMNRAPAQLAITGIPMRRTAEHLADWQNLDSVISTLGTKSYALWVVAEPVPYQEINDVSDWAKRVKDAIHPYTKLSIGRSQSHNRNLGISQTLLTESETGLRARNNTLSSLNQATQDLTASPNILGALSPPFQLFRSVLTFVQHLGDNKQAAEDRKYARRRDRVPNFQSSMSTGSSTDIRAEYINSEAIACEVHLDQFIERCKRGRSGSFWKTVVYVVSDSEATAEAAFGAVRSVCTGNDHNAFEPIQAHRLSRKASDTVRRGQLLKITLPHGQAKCLYTYMTAAELGLLMTLPKRGVPGIPQRQTTPFAVNVPESQEDTITLGNVVDETGRAVAKLNLDRDTLKKHTLVPGLPGSGKTNTCKKLLIEACEHFQVPFLVIEPAKSEYRRLAEIPGLASKLRVYSPGSPEARPLRLNPLMPVPGFSLQTHIDLLKSVFNASFVMYGGMHQILEEALINVYTELGWSLRKGQNNYLPENATFAEQAALIPTLQDLYDQVEVVLAEKNYSSEPHQNLSAALRSRLKGLMLGCKGDTLNTPRSTPHKILFEQPTVIELKHIGDDDEKAFVMAMLLVFLHEYAEVRQRRQLSSRREQLQHLTLVEEAHRLLASGNQSVSAEEGDPRGKGVEMFSNLLAEMRALGEGFIIADQTPTKLAPEILKLTGHKIVHRLVAGDDREAVGAAINLNDAQQQHLVNLQPGRAVVHSGQIKAATLVQVDNVKQDLSNEQLRPSKLTPEELHALRRHSGCNDCAAPCHYYTDLAETKLIAESESALFRLFDMWLQGEDDRFIQLWAELRAQATDLDKLFCLVSQSVFAWLGSLIAGDTTVPLSPTQRIRQDQAAGLLSPMIKALVQGEGDDREDLRELREQVVCLVKGESSV